MRACMQVTVASGFLCRVPLVLTVLLVREVLQVADEEHRWRDASRPSTWPGLRL